MNADVAFTVVQVLFQNSYVTDAGYAHFGNLDLQFYNNPVSCFMGKICLCVCLVMLNILLFLDSDFHFIMYS